jgi:hypothetical protein
MKNVIRFERLGYLRLLRLKNKNKVFNDAIIIDVVNYYQFTSMENCHSPCPVTRIWAMLRIGRMESV